MYKKYINQTTEEECNTYPGYVPLTHSKWLRDLEMDLKKDRKDKCYMLICFTGLVCFLYSSKNLMIQSPLRAPLTQ